MKKVFSVIICISLTLTLCSCGRGLKRFEKTYSDVFDTISSVVAYDTDGDSFEKHCDELHKMLLKYNNLFDIYSSHDGITCLKDINEKAGKSPVKASPEIIDMLTFGKKAYKITGGTVNICMGSVLKIWHDYREEGTRVPEMSTLKKAAEHCDISDLVIDEKNSTVYFADSEMSLDVGAIAKGYAAQKAKEFAQENLWSSALINLGGNIATFGIKPGGAQWTVQIENPDPRATQALTTMGVVDKSVVTSGDYQRFYEVDGKRYCHIIDPKTLMPADNFSSVSIICEDSAIADALSTALFVLPKDEGEGILNSIEGAKAIWVGKDYKIL